MPDAIRRLNAALEERYVVEKELSRGGMGGVFLAREVRHDRGVAIRVLDPELATAIAPERGTPAEHKRWEVYPGGHSVPRNQRIEKTLERLDRYLGPVEGS